MATPSVQQLISPNPSSTTCTPPSSSGGNTGRLILPQGSTSQTLTLYTPPGVAPKSSYRITSDTVQSEQATQRVVQSEPPVQRVIQLEQPTQRVVQSEKITQRMVQIENPLQPMHRMVQLEPPAPKVEVVQSSTLQQKRSSSQVRFNINQYTVLVKLINSN